MRKAIEVLEADAADFRIPSVSILTGDDALLKTLVVNRYAELSGLTREETEKYAVSSADQIAVKVGDPSLFGRRLLDIELSGKWGQLKRLIPVLRDVRDTEDVVVIRVDQTPKQNQLNNLYQEIDCRKLAKSKSRQRLISQRFKHYGLEPTEEAVKGLSERTVFTSEIEASIKTLYFARGRFKDVGLADIKRATAEPPERRDITRALLKGNTTRLAKEINEGDPFYTLIVLHSSLFKLYTYLEMVHAEVEEEVIKERLNIPNHTIKEWRAAQHKYASRLVRETMEVVAEAYDRITSGREGWQEILHYKLKSLD
jgi:DNA polymerase III delta subunit